MGSSESSVKMRLTNTRLSFVQAGTELAYFSDNKLYVTRLEAVEQISIGTSDQWLSRHRDHAHRGWLQMARVRR